MKSWRSDAKVLAGPAPQALGTSSSILGGHRGLSLSPAPMASRLQ